MSSNKIRFYELWRQVSHGYPRKKQVCPRCGNEVEYVLVMDYSEFGLFWPLAIKYNKHYAYKCPICPNYDLIPNELAKAIIKRGFS